MVEQHSKKEKRYDNRATKNVTKSGKQQYDTHTGERDTEKTERLKEEVKKKMWLGC